VKTVPKLVVCVIYFRIGTVMTIKIHAVYRNGVCQPSVTPPIVDGTEVELIVITGGDWNCLVDALDEIARLPMEGPLDGFSGANHDPVLYKTK